MPCLSQGQALRAPGTQAAYPGSRRLRQQYGYKGDSWSGLVELHPDRLLTREEFKANLLAAPGVLKVVDKSTKTSQGNRGNHICERSLNVRLHREPNLALEFELTRNNHMADMEGRPYTETAMFKDPPKRHHAAAWCVLLHAVKGRELLPQHARDYCKACLTRHGTWEADVLPEGLEGVPLEPGFASSAGVEASLSQGGQEVPLEPGFASSAGVEASMSQGGTTAPPAKKSKAADLATGRSGSATFPFPLQDAPAVPGGLDTTLPATLRIARHNLSGRARQVSCPEGLNYSEAGLKELKASERDGSIASLQDARELLLKGLERISGVLPEGRDLDGTEYEMLGTEFERFLEIVEKLPKPAREEEAVAGQDLDADWGEDAADVGRFEITDHLREELAGEPDGDPAAVRESREVWAALGAEGPPIPDFLKVVQGQPMAGNAALDDVRAMKLRAVEHVRYPVVDERDDPEVQDNIDRMRREAWEKHEERRRTGVRGLDTRDMFVGRELDYVKLIGAGSEPMALNEFLNAASKRTLRVKELSRPPSNVPGQEGRLRMLALRVVTPWEDARMGLLTLRAR
ncbi:unnamed protein product [Prorocentrum cordatum]|uniref:Uncharacterized protein n=1 Tax=Prorocentrum cordatum TaxID=2364126 RepID=A0ABN9PW52_9DINO|nr:unnamed protein product [Polarella glacialis]